MYTFTGEIKCKIGHATDVRGTSHCAVCYCSFFNCFCSIYLFILPPCKAIHIAEDLLSSSTIILSVEAHLFCSTSEVALHILISYKAM